MLHEVLNASNYVPQNRLRAFFVAIKSDYNLSFDFSKLVKKSKISVKEAIGELYELDKISKKELKNKPINKFTKYSGELIKIYNHDIIYPAKTTQDKISYVPQGGNWKDIPLSQFKNNRNNRHSSAFKRLHEDECSVTIDTGNAHSKYFHPIYNRIPTVREAARIQSFKDSFIIEGSRTSQYRQIGNAVPPLLAKVIAIELKNILEKK